MVTYRKVLVSTGDMMSMANPRSAPEAFIDARTTTRVPA